MANVQTLDPLCSAQDEDWRLPGLELQHELLLSLKDWSSLGSIADALAAAGADVHALSLHRNAGAFVLKCRVKSISAAQARAFVNDVNGLIEGAASVEHLMLAKAGDHVGA